MSELKVSVTNGKSYQVESADTGQFRLDGELQNLDIQKIGDNKFHIIRNNKSYQAELVEADYESKTFKMLVNNQIYTLEVEDRFDLLLQKLGMEDLAAAGVTDLKAPMPGLVLSIDVEVGQTIKQDEPLIVLEAMKMENVLKAPADLVIKSIPVNNGEAVEKNQILLEFE